MTRAVAAALRSRGLSARKPYYTVSTFLGVQRALQSMLRRASGGEVLSARTIIMTRPIVFEETVSIPSGLDGVTFRSERSIDHRLGSGASVYFDVYAENFTLDGMATAADASATLVRSMANIGFLNVYGCLVRADKLFDGNGNINSRAVIRGNQGLGGGGKIVGGLDVSVIGDNVNIQSVDSNGETMFGTVIGHNTMAGDITLDGSSASNVVTGNFCGVITSNSSSGGNVIGNNVNTGRTSHGTDLVSNNAV